MPDAKEELNLMDCYGPHRRQLGSIWLTPWPYETLFSFHGFPFSFLMQLGACIGKDSWNHTVFLVSRMLGISGGHSLSMCFV